MVLLQYVLEMIGFAIFNIMHEKAEILIQTVISYHCILSHGRLFLLQKKRIRIKKMWKVLFFFTVLY